MRGMGWIIKKIDSLQAMSLFRTIAIASQFWFSGEDERNGMDYKED